MGQLRGKRFHDMTSGYDFSYTITYLGDFSVYEMPPCQCVVDHYEYKVVSRWPCLNDGEVVV